MNEEEGLEVDDGYGLIGTDGSVTNAEGLELNPLLVKAA